MIQNKMIKSTLLAAMLFSTNITAEELLLNVETLAKLKKTVNVLKNPKISVVDGIDKGSYYFLQLDVKKKGRTKKVNAFLEKESGAVYIGTRYEKNGVKMSFPKTAKSIATIKEGVSFSYGNGKKDLYVVTDPECPYCVKFEKQAQGKLEDYTVHVILYPLSFHKKAPAMLEWIMQGTTDAEKKHRMEEVMVNKSQKYAAFLGKKGQKFSYTDTIKVKIDNAIKAGKALGATGTPTVYDADFNKVNWKSLLVSKPKNKAVTK